MMMDGSEPGLGTGWSGILLVAVVLVTILGGMLLALVDARQSEGVAEATAEPTPLPSETPSPEIQIIVALPSPIPSLTPTLLPSPTPTLLPSPTLVATPGITATAETPEPTATPEPTPEPTPTLEPTLIPGMVERCVPPAGWVPYTVRRGDTLFSLSLGHGAGVEAIKIANCLTSDVILQGDVIYLPTAPLPTPPPRHCSGPPLDWVLYTVRPGDTMFSLARSRGVTVYDVLLANCRESVYLYAGTPLYLPPAAPGPTPVPGTTPVVPPATPEPGAACRITSPANGATVRGDVAFYGTATADDFQFFKLEALGPGTGGSWASLLGRVVYTPVQDGLLGTASLALWEPGAYAVRLVVIDSTGNEAASCALNLTLVAP